MIFVSYKVKYGMLRELTLKKDDQVWEFCMYSAHMEKYKDCPRFALIADEIRDIIDGEYLVGYNMKTLSRFLSKWYLILGETILLTNVIDIRELHYENKTRIQTIYENRIGDGYSDDFQATKELVDFFRHYYEKPYTDLTSSAYYGLEYKDDEWYFTNGPYRGQKVDEVPKDYLQHRYKKFPKHMQKLIEDKVWT